MDAIERFAADVAHEIKNPLSSLKSAVETAVRIEDPANQRQLMAIILDDVERLDRLITDISDASRLDAELCRLELQPVDVAAMLAGAGRCPSRRPAAAMRRSSVSICRSAAGRLLRARHRDPAVQVFR